MTPSLGARLYTLVGGTAGVQALIGNPARLYPLRAPQAAVLPRVVYTVVSETPIGAIGEPNSGLTRARVQFDCFARLYDDACSVAAAVAAALTTGSASLWLQGFDYRDVPVDEIEASRRVLDAVLHVKE